MNSYRPFISALTGATVLVLLLLSFGCSRDVQSILFDGVPAPPVPEEFCSSWLAAKRSNGTNGGNGTNGTNGIPGSVKTAAATRPKGSVHAPFAEKRCSDCHDQTKGTGLLLPKNTLCFKCHDEIVTGPFNHAPAVSGDCLACHLPHDSGLPTLLKAENGKLCGTCHAEQRSYVTLHKRAAQKNIHCYDCHNPHAGDNRYFLK